jgi:ABC-type sugar transport system permease subunit
MTNAQYRSRLQPTRSRWQRYWGLVFVAPFFVLFAVFSLYPIAFSLWLSLHEWNGVPKREIFVGLENFRLALRDGLFWESILNVVIVFVMHLPLMLFLALVLAVLLNQHFLKLQGLWRALIFLPHLTSMVAAGFTFRLILEKQTGFANAFLALFGLPGVPWLDSVWWARISVSLLLLWAWTGYQMVIFLSALQTIPAELNEAAMMDGANRVQVFRFITVPLLKPVIVFCFTVSLIGTFALYTEPTILTGGGPIHATATPTMEIFGNAFGNLKYGYAAALSYLYFLLVVIATLLQLRLTSQERT